MGRGKYNIGMAGLAKAGKSSLLNSILGSSTARTGSTECTQQATFYPLPLDDPQGLLNKFIAKLPRFHQRCVRKCLRHVKLWDLPGSGTRRHPSTTYIQDNGLSHYDFVVHIIGPTVMEEDIQFANCLVRSGVKHIAVRSMLDLTLKGCFNEHERRVGRRLREDEKYSQAVAEIDRIRETLVQELRQEAPEFRGHLYFVAAMERIPISDPDFMLVDALSEVQLAIDWMFLDIIIDRHGHDLSRYFDASLYGRAARVVFNWFADVDWAARALANATAQAATAGAAAAAAEGSNSEDSNNSGIDGSAFDEEAGGLSTLYQHDVFISYSVQDSEDVMTAVANVFRTCGYNVFNPKAHLRDTEEGRVTKEEMQNHVRGSKIFLMIISERYLDSEWCRAEVLAAQQAQRAGTKVFPCYAGEEYTRKQVLKLKRRSDVVHDFIFSQNLNDIHNTEHGEDCVERIRAIAHYLSPRS